MQENRSFDHYFGTLSGVRGFSDPDVLTNNIDGDARPGLGPVRLPARRRRRPVGLPAALRPAAASSRPTTATAPTTSPTSGGRSTRAGTTAGWTPSSRRTWRPTATPTSSPPWATSTAAELPFYYTLADAFTICDAYHCSVLGPTDPNRVMALSGTIDPGGEARRSGPRHPDQRPASAVREVRRGPPCPSSCSMRA